MNLLSMAYAWCSAHLFPCLGRTLQQKISDMRLQATVRSAYRHVPWYRCAFDQRGIDGSQFRVEELSRLPLLSKEQFKANFPDGIIAKNQCATGAIRSSTSGSSGKPLQLIYPRKTYAYYLATAMRVYSMVGYRPWHKLTFIKRMDLERPAVNLGPFFRVNHLSSDWSTRRLVQALLASKPDVLVGFPSVILAIARQLQQQPGHTLRLKLISVNSEASTQQERDFIADVLRCPVFDEYSSQETWMIAAQCRAGGYHLFTDNVHVEILHADGTQVPNGELGEVVITTLNNPLMPLIRYRLGDIARRQNGRCKCGSALPLIASVEGRINDALKMPSGRIISPLRVAGIASRFAHDNPNVISNFKIVQTELRQIEVQIVADLEYCQAKIDSLLRSIQQLMDDDVRVRGKLCTEIDAGRIKRRTVENHVSG